ncbi:hypothetical protein EBB_23390 [Methylomonas sp. EbB]|uniref:Uncharacterized protein n=2 Tax=Methylomonas fluvii TaxID=1854564 RepID=A0ABR9DMA1_9GAMM|nr:hypothetical protein [Methylomonas fluvii]MBD9363369.1 hypothetical protein [Methylomonas fluvii]
MLKSLDVLLGLSVVMLIVSMAVTLISQGILNLLASRGRNLRTGLADLLELLDARFSRTEAEAISALILTQRTIGGRCRCRLPVWLQFFQFGEVIHREEFIKILLDLAAGYDVSIKTDFEQIKARLANKTINVGQATEALETKLLAYPLFFKRLGIEALLAKIKKEKAETKKQQFQQLEKIVAGQIDLLDKLKSVLHDSGIEDPAATLKNARMLALEFEKSNPELAHDVREANALLQEASSDFLAKICLNFDHLLDRVTVRFTATTRVVSVISAALVAIALQLDTVNLINRLSMDEQMRAAFVELAPKLTEDPQIKDAIQSDDAKVSGEQDAETSADETVTVKERIDLAKQKYYLNFLAEQGLISLPVDRESWCKHWKLVSIPGLILSIFLLSLGGPFWYNALSKLVQLRSGLARKDDEQKAIRQTTQASGSDPQTSDTSPTPNPLQGERGDMKAQG